MDFPTLGLNFDLNELIEGMRRLAQAKAGFVDVGRAADQAGDQAENAGRQMSEASLRAEAAAFRAARGHNTEEEAVRSKMRQLRDLERIMRDIERVERFQKRTDPALQEYERQQAALRRLGQTIDLVARDNVRAAREQQEGWRRVADAIRIAADQTVRAAQADAEARVRITQAQIAQNRQSALTRESLAREAMLVDRLTKELNELGQARSSAARQSAAPGANADLAGAAAATTVIPVIGAAQSGLNSRARQLAENEARERGRRGILAYIAALLGLGNAYDTAGRKQHAFGNVLGGFGNMLRQLRLRAFDLRFAFAALFGALTLGPLAAMADQMVALESRTRLYAERASDVPVLLEETYQVAQRARAGLEGVATLYTRLAPLGQTLGRSQMQLLRVVETVSKAFSIGGAAASEATAGAQQFAQALSSNRFGGDELRSVAENAPVLLAAIAEGVNQINPALNLNAATFIKWAHEGNANAEIMVRALELAADKIDRMFASTTPTISQATTVVRNALTKMVDEVDRQAGEAGMRLSTNIAMGLTDFADFLTRDSTIDAVVNTINALKIAFDIAGAAIQGVITYFPALVTGLVAFTVAARAALIASTLATVMKTLGTLAAATALQFTAAGGGLAIFSGAAGVASAAAVRLGAAIRTAGMFLLGPVGMAIGLTAAVAGLSYMSGAMLETSGATDKLRERTEASVNALERAVMFVNTYGGATEAAKDQVAQLNAVIDSMIGITADQTKGMDAATAAAYRRAKMEQQLTVALLRRAAAESLSAATDLDRSAGMKRLDAKAGEIAARLPASQLRLPGAQSPEQLREAAARARIEAENETALARQLRDGTPFLMRAADQLEGMDVTIPTIPDGLGTRGGAAADDGKGGKGMAGAINAVATLRAEVLGLNAQIAALSTNPLADVAARITAAGREAAASRTAGKGAGFADEAQRLAMLKEEATIRMDLTRALVDQAQAAERAGQIDFYGAMYDADARAAMQAFYTGAERSSAAYASALAAQADAAVKAKKEQANLELAQQYGVTTTNEIADAYRKTLQDAGLLTAETSAYADALQIQAQRTYEAQAAAIDLAEARARAAKVGDARLTYQAETDDLIQYAAALRAGAAAVDDYNRRRRERAILDAEGPAATPGARLVQPLMAAMQDQQAQEASYTAEWEKRTAEAREQLRLAGETTRYRQIEAEALELAAAAGRTLANEADRAKAAILITAREAAALATSIQDAVRQGFIETGKIDSTVLKDALKRAFRQAVYDELLAKPIQVVVNAVVNVITKGLEKLLDKIADSVSGGEGGVDGAMDWLGDKFGSGMDKLGTKIGSLIDKIPAGIRQGIGNAIAGFAAGSAVSDLIGLEGSDSRWQQVGDVLGATAGTIIGTMIGGPIGGFIGAAIGTIVSRLAGTLFGSKDRPLAITALEVRGGQFQSMGTRGYDDGPTEEIDAAGKQLAVLLNQIAKVFDLNLEKAEGLYTVFGWTAGENTKALGGEGFFGGMLRGISDLRGMSLDDIKGSALGRGVDLSQVKDAEEAIDRILRETIIRIGDAVDDPFTEAEKALIRAADSLEEAAQTLYAARNVENNLERALLKYTDPREFEIQNLRDQQMSRRQEILNLVNQGLIGEDRLPGIEGLLQDLERQELTELLGRFATGLDGAVSSLEDLRAAQERIADYARGLITGNLSPLSPQAKLEASQTEYFRLLALAQAGDAEAMERLTGASSEYLSAAQRYFASSPAYSRIFEQVYNQLVALSEQEFEDPLIGTIENEVQRLIDAINAGFLLIYNGDGPDDPELPDSPPVPGTGGTGGGVGGGLDGYGRRPVDDELIGITRQGFDEISQGLSALALAIQAANDTNAQTIVQGLQDGIKQQAALVGGIA